MMPIQLVYAQPPVIVEFFTNPGCSEDIATAEFYNDIVEQYSDLHITGCMFSSPDDFIFNDSSVENAIGTYDHGHEVSNPFYCSQRYHKYSQRLQPYIGAPPGFIINGDIMVQGLDKALFDSAIAMVRAERHLQTIPLVFSRQGDDIEISFSAMALEGPADIVLYSWLNDKNIYIPAANENSQDQVIAFKKYAENVETIGVWDGKSEKQNVQINIPEGHNLTILIQKPDQGQVLAAGVVSE